ncbi:hypothetical protein MHU86_18590 [Fragilaria crotonensis]|nr:hypothetical protein MHU86_18590 [Fragilaria crotonensis]
MTKSSPRLSISSADEALFEILGVDKLVIDADDDDDDGDTDSEDHESHHHDTEDGSSTCDSASGSNDGTMTSSTTTTTAVHHTPPRHCHRPLTPHTPLLLETRSLLLSPAQCSYIIHNLGYRTTNNGGKTFGPTYVTAAALSPQQHQERREQRNVAAGDGSDGGVTVQLLNPNHHKVCVFYSDLVLIWLQQAFQKAGIDEAIQSWCRKNGIQGKKDDSSTSSSYDYRINPRLRLLRYDTADHDIFLPHYDATTTTTTTTKDKKMYESKLTILLYLNTGGGVHFHGGNTVFLNSLQPSENMLEVVPKLGKFLVFNHELYHASQGLTLNVDDQNCGAHSGGGTKFVLRSDVMFPIQNVATETNHTSDKTVSSSLLLLPTQDDDHDDNQASRPADLLPMTVQTVLDQLAQSVDMEDDHHDNLETLIAVLQQLDIDPSMPLTTLMSLGEVTVVTMMMDLGLEKYVAERFYRHCQETSASRSSSSNNYN